MYKFCYVCSVMCVAKSIIFPSETWWNIQELAWKKYLNSARHFSKLLGLTWCRPKPQSKILYTWTLSHVFLSLHQQVLCSQAQAYNDRGVLCDARDEGPLRRNPGNHNRNVVERLPTSAEVEFTLSLTNYDTGAMDRGANMSFRNTLEGEISWTPRMHTHTPTVLLCFKWYHCLAAPSWIIYSSALLLVPLTVLIRYSGNLSCPSDV